MATDGITIIIRAPGAEPQGIEGVAGFSLVTIPTNDPDNNTAYAGNLDPETLGRVGMWQITLAKSLKDGTRPRPLGQDFTEAELRAMRMRREGRTESGLILPN